VSIERRVTKRRGVVWEVRLRSTDGREYSRTFPTKREAEAFEGRERTDRARGAWIDPRRLLTPFRAVATAWLDSNPGRRPTTAATDAALLRLHILPTLGHRPIGSITPADVQRLVNDWSGHHAPRTVKRTYGTLRAVLNYAST
jgi:hypothetical protein